MLFGLSDVLAVALSFLAVTGIGDGIQDVSRLTYLQTRVEVRYHGRVFALVESLVSLPLLAGMMGAGYLRELWGARGVALTAAALIVSAGLLYTFLAPRCDRKERQSAA